MSVLVRFRELKARRIVSNHVTLKRWIEKEGFPRGYASGASPMSRLGLPLAPPSGASLYDGRRCCRDVPELGAPLTEPRKLKDFCNYSCRGQHSVNALDGEKYRGAYLGSKNTKRTKALRSLKRQSVGHFAFCKLNPVTYRIDRQGRNGVGWLTEVAWPGETKKQRWIACVGNHRSEPLRLGEAKESARVFLTTKSQAEHRDFIKELNQLAANEVDQAYWTQEKRTWPLDLMGGQRHRKPLREVERNLRQAILDTEQVLKDDKPATGSVQGDDCQLEYYEDGYPKLPTCLDRREAAA